MGFSTGFVLGTVIGLGSAMVIGPSDSKALRDKVVAAVSSDGKVDPSATFRKATEFIKDQASEAMVEARLAAEEAAEEMKVRYRASINN